MECVITEWSHDLDFITNDTTPANHLSYNEPTANL